MKFITRLAVASCLAFSVICGVSTVEAYAGPLQDAVYSHYQDDCGGTNPWHSGTFWWCTDRNVELQTIAHWNNWHDGDVVYCYSEAAVGSAHERCVEARAHWPGYGAGWVTAQLAYWTNA